MKDENESTFGATIDWIDRNANLRISIANIENLVRTAQLYQIARLEEEIETFLKSQEASYELYIIALKYQLSDYIAVHQQWSFNYFSELLSADLVSKLDGKMVDLKCEFG